MPWEGSTRGVRPEQMGLSREADARTRTGDPFITSEVLYQLSYVGNRPTVAIFRDPVSGRQGVQSVAAVRGVRLFGLFGRGQMDFGVLVGGVTDRIGEHVREVQHTRLEGLGQSEACGGLTHHRGRSRFARSRVCRIQRGLRNGACGVSSVDVRQVRTDRYSFVFGPYAEPIATVRSGELLDVFTDDAFGSRVQSEDDLPTQVLEWPYVNPQTGPIYVEGAEKGDTLAVEIVEIEPTRAFVASAHIPYFGGLTGTDRTALLNEPLPEQVFIYPLRDGQIELPRGIRIPYEPFLGTIATSPEIEAIATLVPGPFGGNMDVPDVCPGNTVRLPVSVEGAYFYTGDAHAAQGDGELCGVACEVTARVRLRLSVEKGRPSSGPASSRRPSSWPWAARGRWRTRPGSRGSS